MVTLEIDQNSLKTRKISVNHFYPGAGRKVRPWLARKLGVGGGLERTDFGVVQWSGRFSHSHDLQNSRCDDQRPPIVRLEAAKQVTGEQRKFDLLYAIRPLPDAGVHRQKALKTLRLEFSRNERFFASPDL